MAINRLATVKTDVLEAALECARKGYPVFPLAVGKKTPIKKGWPDSASSDEDTVREMFADTSYNLGVATGEVSRLLVVDVDSYKEEEGWRQLCSELSPLPDTYTVKTRAGGTHYYFEYPSGRGIRNSAGKLAECVDIRAEGGYVVGPTSWVQQDDKGAAGKYDVINDVDLAELPEDWIGRLVIISVSSSAKGHSVPELIPPSKFTLPERIPDGTRNETLIRYAGQLRNKGLAESAIESYVLIANRGRCDPPLDESEVLQIAQQYAGQAVQLPEDGAHEHDIANGKLFAIAWRRQLLFVHDTNVWLSFDRNSGWLKTAPKSEEAAAKEAVTILRKKAADAYAKDPDSSRAGKLMARVKRASQLAHLRAMIEMAKSEQGISEQLSSFDADNFVLGVSNGIIDLQSRKLAPFTPEVLVSNRANVMYDPNAGCPRFKQYLKEVVPDDDCRAFLQRWCGYCLTGSVSEQKMLFLHGAGRNGKSVFIELQAHMLGNYGKKIQTEMLMKHFRSPQAASPDIVGLKARRLVYCNETTEGRFFDDARIKELTGGDTLVGRVPYAKSDIEFYPTHKLMIVGNHLPSVTDLSRGFWRRVILFPFEQIIPEESVDKDLLDKLKKEAPGILNWMLDGLDQGTKNGLSIPKVLESATNAYMNEHDILAEWLDEQCERGGSCAKAELYGAYKWWCQKNGFGPLGRNRFSRQLRDKGYVTASDNRTITGIELTDAAKKETMLATM